MIARLFTDGIISNVNKSINTLKKLEESHSNNTKNTLILEKKILDNLNNNIKRRPKQDKVPKAKIILNELKLNDKDINTAAVIEDINKSGTYVAVDYTDASVKELNNILKLLNVKKDTNDPFHTTIAYSTKSFIFSPKTCLSKRRSRKFVPKNNNKVIVTGLELFDEKNLHLTLNAPFCEEEFKRAQKAGAEYDYDKYIPHITLAYESNFNSKKLDEFKKDNSDILKKIIGTRLILKDEYVEKLDLNKK